MNTWFVFAAVLFIVIGIPWLCSHLDDGPNPLTESDEMDEDADFFA